MEDIFGRPGEGVHSHRFLGLASVDLGLTFVAALFVAWAWEMPIWKSFLILFFIGFLFHIAFGVKTAFVRLFAG